jgi:iron uptake system component EfeO
VNVSITPDGCEPDRSSVPAGPTEFKIHNNGADSITEAELLGANDVIVGEKENLAAGLSGSFTLNVKPGRYQLYCPGGKTAEKVPFTVTETAADQAPAVNAAKPELSAATAGYAVYVKGQVAQLVTNTEAFVAAVKAGDLPRAKALYPAPRANYERIEPVAESFGDLDPAIDARIDDVSDPAKWTGFHRLEKAIFQDNTLAGMTPIADQLRTDVTKLQTLVATETYQPAQLANGATGLLDETGKTKITGEEERYSHLDLVDMVGNVDGADQAFVLLQPALKKLDPTLEKTIATRFAAMYAAFQPYQRGSGYVSYDKVTQAQRRSLSDAVNALAEPLSQVAGVVVS